MSDNSAIEWTDATWNPVTGCTEVSPGCDHCYAKTFAERFRGTPGHYFQNGFDVQVRKDKVNLPLKWRKPRKVFVNSMSDLFHEAVPTPWLADIFAVMAATPRHTYQVLTKRHGRMRSLLNDSAFRAMVADRIWGKGGEAAELPAWPLPNVWLGVSVEDQKWADIRIPALLDTPAAVRWLSCEPLLGPVDLLGKPDQGCDEMGPAITHGPYSWQSPDGPTEYDCEHNAGIDWVVAGGESGRGARPMHPDWARSLRDQCVEMQIPFLFKQWGNWVALKQVPYSTDISGREPQTVVAGKTVYRVSKKAAGRELDGRTWDQYPAVAS